MKRLLLLTILSGGCALPAKPGSIPFGERDRLQREYATCFRGEEVAALRASYLDGFPGWDAGRRGRQFDAWRESEIARIFGPKPVASGVCERHGLPLVTGIAPTEFGLRNHSAGGIRIIDLDDPNAFRDLHAPPQPLHPMHGAFLGCQVVSAFSWSVYCAACEAEQPAWLAYARQ